MIIGCMIPTFDWKALTVLMKVNNNFNQVGIPSIELHQRSFQLSRVKKLDKLKNKLKLTINER